MINNFCIFPAEYIELDLVSCEVGTEILYIISKEFVLQGFITLYRTN
jgi:hypothetical protein